MDQYKKDFIENKAFEAISGNNPNSAVLTHMLKTKCRDRGYGDRVEITGADGQSLFQQMIIEADDAEIIEDVESKTKWLEGK